MVQEHAPFSRDFFPAALEYSPSQDPWITHIRWEMVINDKPDAANTGYWLFRRFGYQVYSGVYDHSNNIMYDLLREMGYVFWDYNRVKTAIPRANLERSRNAPESDGDLSDGDVSSRRLRRNRLSVKERLKGVVLPEGEKRRIAEMFEYSGWVDDADEDGNQ